MPKKQARKKEAAWTFLVYMAGDNSLTEEMTWGLQELKKAAGRVNRNRKPKDRINVVAHFDPRGSRGRRYDFFPPAAQAPPPGEDGNLERYEAMVYTDGLVQARTRSAVRDLRTPGGKRPRSSNQLAAFLLEQVELLDPAQEYFLVLSGHGSGAVGDFLTDSDPDTSLSIPELARILAIGTQLNAKKNRQYEPRERGKPRIPKRIAILGMDSCLMSNAEACFEFREHACLLVASEGFVASAGWPYHRVLEALARTRSRPLAAARRVAESYARFYRDYEIAGISTDIAVCDLEAVGLITEGSLIGRVRALAKACIPSLEAAYVRDVLSATQPDLDGARNQAVALSEEIARNLKGDRWNALAKRLRNGSAGARKDLEARPWRRKLGVSQLEALREFLESMNRSYHLGARTLGARLKTLNRRRLRQEIQGPMAPARALAVARVLREFDPGVQEALRIIEEQDAKGGPGRAAARTARRKLQKLHQLRTVLDLHDLVGAAPAQPDADGALRDALVGARGQAQSFKANVYVDLFDLCRCLESRLAGDALGQLCGMIREAIEGAVLSSHFTGPAFQHAHGLSVYFPTEARDYASEYENLEFAEQTGWGRFVRAFLRASRRSRRDEGAHWSQADHPVLRFGDLEIDPLETDTLEARIVGLIRPPSNRNCFRADKVRASTEKRIRPRKEGRAGSEGRIRAGSEGRIRAGTEGRIRAGTEGRIRAGTEGRIKGDSITAVWGNPPDGFFRQ